MLHVMLDLYGCPPELLADEAFLRQVLDNYPARIAMEMDCARVGETSPAPATVCCERSSAPATHASAIASPRKNT